MKGNAGAQELIKKAAIPPSARLAKILELVKGSSLHRDPTMIAFGMDLEPKPVKVRACRTLPRVGPLLGRRAAWLQARLPDCMPA